MRHPNWAQPRQRSANAARPGVWRGFGRLLVHLRHGAEAALALGAAAVLVIAPQDGPQQWIAPAHADAGPASAARALAAASFAAPSFAAPSFAALETAAAEALLAPVVSLARETEARLGRGETLQQLMIRAGVGVEEAAAAAAAFGAAFDARRLQAGQEVALFLEGTAAGDTRLAGFALEPEPARTLHLARGRDDAFRVRDVTLPTTRRVSRVSGQITGSLYADASRAGAPNGVLNQITQLLAHTVDFQREIRPGDEFDITFEHDVGPDGRTVRSGPVLHVRFTPAGRTLEYWRFAPAPDERPAYYDRNGVSAMRFLMRTPIDGARLSSHFGMRRHPVLGYNRLHKGADFAAPTGTPIYAAGDGVVEKAERFGSFGNYVRLRHANGYQTAYAHLNGYARGMRAGVRVTQGEIIGYVGTTGRSTGPHLHYEVIKDGRHVNPMSIDAPTGRALDPAERANFDVERAILDVLRDSAGPPPSARSLLVAEAPEAAASP